MELREENNRMILTCSHLHTKASQPEKTENSSQLHGTDFSGHKVSEASYQQHMLTFTPYRVLWDTYHLSARVAEQPAQPYPALSWDDHVSLLPSTLQKGRKFFLLVLYTMGCSLVIAILKHTTTDYRTKVFRSCHK